MNYTVNFWGSNPDLENDDLWYALDFETKAEALATYSKPVEDIEGCPARDVGYIEVDGPDVNECRKNPTFKESKRMGRQEDLDWQREIAMEAGMLHGCEAYNDEMGY